MTDAVATGDDTNEVDQGRRKFLTPLYRELLATDWGKEEAKLVYGMARPHYHAVAT